MQPPQGLAEKVRGPEEAEVDRRLAAEDGAQRPCPGGRARPATTSTSTCCRSRPAGRATRRRSSRCPAVITKDPRTGARNVGMYRMQELDRRSTAMHWQIHKDGRAGLPARPTASSRSPSRSGSTRSPPTRRARRCPKHIDELMLAGFLRGEPVELVHGEDRRPRGAGERRDRARGLRRQGRRSSERGARSATTPATTRRPSRSRSSTSRR